MADQEPKPTDNAVEMKNAEEGEQKPVIPAFPNPDTAAQLQGLQGLSGLMQNPEILAALQDKLGSMVGGQSGYIQSLPKVVKRRLKALKKLQNEMIKIESKFYEEVHELECKYAEQYRPLYERRRDVGEYWATTWDQWGMSLECQSVCLVLNMCQVDQSDWKGKCV